ncbi:hypothetical protein [Cochleicola gelatinilyticus]|nr:hypothetical protein [Cochleicola gelatinilyticus]
MSDNDKKNKDKQSEERDSLNPERIKGPQKDEHTNQYGDQDDSKKPSR